MQTKKRKKGILIISPTFSPNIGGVETHLDDLIKELCKSKHKVYVHTYSPITTPGVFWKSKEKFNNINITRYGWFGKTLLHRIENFPAIDFLYITPYLFLRVLFFMLLNHKKIDIIHAQGFNAAFIGMVLKKIFKKKLIVSTHALYNINNNSKTSTNIKKILSAADLILTLADTSLNQIASFGINKKKLKVYYYWIDLNSFRPLEKKIELRKQFNIEDKFTVLFVGRLTNIKGVKELVSVAEKLLQINFIFIGNGPMEDFLSKSAKRINNIKFLGSINNKNLCEYYNMADLFCIPSQYEEGFGRVVMEAVACGLPVVGSNRGGISRALNKSVSILVEPTVENLSRAIRFLYEDKNYYDILKSNCRSYAETKFGLKNFSAIIHAYENETEYYS